MKHFLQEALEEVMYATPDLGLSVQSYSGRGMFGKHCLAVTTPQDFSEIGLGAALMIYAGDNDFEMADLLLQTQRDQMGLGAVLYWPAVPYME
jgi:hypothetical protein